jgi:hypothetical protein
MTKGKYHHKRELARRNASQELPKTVLPHSEAEPAKKQGKNAHPVSHKKERLVRFRESVKRSSFTDWCIAAFTLVLSVVAIYQYVVLGGQLDVMRKDQRPWMKLSFDNFKLQINSPIGGNFHMVNNGKTVAKNIEGKFVIEKVLNGQQPRLDYGDAWISFTGGTIFPNEPEVRGMAMQHLVQKLGGSSYEPTVLSQSDFDDFVAGNIFFVAYAKVSYSDFFGVRHWTQFCSFETPSASSPGNETKTVTAKNCTDYNDIDDN